MKGSLKVGEPEVGGNFFIILSAIETLLKEDAFFSSTSNLRGLQFLHILT